MLISDALARTAFNHPDADFVVAESTADSYRSHADRADRLATGLAELGCEPGDRVAILAENTRECLEVFSACERSGLVAVPLNYRLTPDDLEWILHDSAPVVVIFQDTFRDTVAALRQRLPTVREWIEIGRDSGAGSPYTSLLGQVAARSAARVRSADLAYLIYTSGTTGRPKGVMLSQRAAYSMARTIALEGGIDATDRFLLTMPLYHIGGKSVQLAHLLRGGSVALVPRFSPSGVLSAIERHGATTILLAPTMLRALLDDPSFAPSRVATLRKIFYAAAPVQPDLLVSAMKAFGNIFTQFYGSTEGGAVSTVLAESQHEMPADGSLPARLQSAGRACIDCEVKVVDEHGAEVGPAVVGEVLTRTPAMMDGYWNNDAGTGETLRDGWLQTGDLGYLDDEGFLYLVDRRKDVIVTGGENVYSLEVEQALMQHEAVAECAVIGVPDRYWGEAVLAVVVRKESHAASEDELIGHCGRRLAGYKKPKRVEFVDELPRLPSGKVKKAAIREPYWAGTSRRI